MTAKENFESIYNEYHRAVESYFLKRVPPDDAEDLTQQTFMKIWVWISDNKPIKAYKSLLFATAKTTLADFYRKKALTVPLEDSAENIESVCSVSFENVVIMRSIISTLSPEEKVIIGLKAQGLSSKEIGKIINISASAVRSRLQNIRKRFK